MDINEFAGRLSEIIEERYSVHTEVINNVKQGDVRVVGLVLIPCDADSVRPIVYVNEMFESFLYEGVDIDMLANKVYATLDEALQCSPPIASLSDFSAVKGMLRIAVASEYSKLYLKDSIAIKKYDMFFFPILYFGNGMRCCVKSNFLDVWNVNSEDVWKCAYENMKEDFRIVTMLPLMKNKFLYAVSTDDLTNGASALLYPSHLSALVRSVGLHKVYVIASSVNDLLFLQSDLTVQEVRQLVSEVNTSTVPESEIASYDVFLLDADTKKLTVM